MTVLEGVYRHQLVEYATPLVDDAEQGALARAAIDACSRIEAALVEEVGHLRPLLDEAGVRVDGVEPLAGRQNHTITFLVPDPEHGERGAAALEPLGFERWERWTGGALESFRRSADQVTAARTDDVTMVIRFRWRPRRHRSTFERAITPTAGDWHLVRLPTWAWWAYPAVRLARLTAERVGLRPKHRASLGPFLATPDALLEPLFERAGITADDVVADLGAGDGRIVAAAAERSGCRGIGVEHDTELVAAARRRLAVTGLGDRVTVVHGDARTFDVSEATVVFVFLPIDVVADLFDDLVGRLAPGTRVLVHEQSRLPSGLRPDSSAVVVGDDAVSVAHLWTVG